MAFDRTRANLRDLLAGEPTRALARVGGRLAANLARGKVEITDAAVNAGLRDSIRGSDWLFGAEVECRDGHFGFALQLRQPVRLTLELPLTIPSIELTSRCQRIVFERIAPIDLRMERPLQQGLARLGRRIVEDVLGFDPIRFTLNRLPFVRVDGNRYEVDLGGLPEARDRMLRPFLGRPLVDWITVREIAIVPGAFRVRLFPMPRLLERLRPWRPGKDG